MKASIKQTNLEKKGPDDESTTAGEGGGPTSSSDTNGTDSADSKKDIKMIDASGTIGAVTSLQSQSQPATDVLDSEGVARWVKTVQQRRENEHSAQRRQKQDERLSSLERPLELLSALVDRYKHSVKSVHSALLGGVVRRLRTWLLAKKPPPKNESDDDYDDIKTVDQNRGKDESLRTNIVKNPIDVNLRLPLPDAEVREANAILKGANTSTGMTLGAMRNLQYLEWPATLEEAALDLDMNVFFTQLEKMLVKLPAWVWDSDDIGETGANKSRLESPLTPVFLSTKSSFLKTFFKNYQIFSFFRITPSKWVHHLRLDLLQRLHLLTFSVADLSSLSLPLEHALRTTGPCHRASPKRRLAAGTPSYCVSLETTKNAATAVTSDKISAEISLMTTSSQSKFNGVNLLSLKKIQN